MDKKEMLKELVDLSEYHVPTTDEYGDDIVLTTVPIDDVWKIVRKLDDYDDSAMMLYLLRKRVEVYLNDQSIYGTDLSRDFVDGYNTRTKEVLDLIDRFSPEIKSAPTRSQPITHSRRYRLKTD